MFFFTILLSLLIKYSASRAGFFLFVKNYWNREDAVCFWMNDELLHDCSFLVSHFSTFKMARLSLMIQWWSMKNEQSVLCLLKLFISRHPRWLILSCSTSSRPLSTSKFWRFFRFLMNNFEHSRTGMFISFSLSAFSCWTFTLMESKMEKFCEVFEFVFLLVSVYSQQERKNIGHKRREICRLSHPREQPKIARLKTFLLKAEIFENPKHLMEMPETRWDWF